MALASEIICFSPALKLSPALVIFWLIPLGNFLIIFSPPIEIKICSISSSLIFSLPKRILLAIVPLIKTGSCKTIPICSRYVRLGSVVISMPST